MAVKLTDRFLTSRKRPTAGRETYTDATVPGLTFRVSASTKSNPEGRRDWLLRYRLRGQAQRAAALGAYPAVTLSNARRRAGEIIAAAKGGIDLISAEEREAEERRAATAKARPLSEIASAYLDRVKRLRSWRNIESRTRSRSLAASSSEKLREPMWWNFSTA